MRLSRLISITVGADDWTCPERLIDELSFDEPYARLGDERRACPMVPGYSGRIERAPAGEPRLRPGAAASGAARGPPGVRLPRGASRSSRYAAGGGAGAEPGRQTPRTARCRRLLSRPSSLVRTKASAGRDPASRSPRRPRATKLPPRPQKGRTFEEPRIDGRDQRPTTSNPTKAAITRTLKPSLTPAGGGSPRGRFRRLWEPPRRPSRVDWSTSPSSHSGLVVPVPRGGYCCMP